MNEVKTDSNKLLNVDQVLYQHDMLILELQKRVDSLEKIVEQIEPKRYL